MEKSLKICLATLQLQQTVGTARLSQFGRSLRQTSSSNSESSCNNLFHILYYPQEVCEMQLYKIYNSIQILSLSRIFI